MRVIIRGMEDRRPFIDYLQANLPEAEWCYDEIRDGMDTFIRAMRKAGDEPCIHMEDDTILSKDFLKNAMKVIRQKPFNVINFFSMRKDDVEIGSRWNRQFSACVCFYLPPTYSRLIADYRQSIVDGAYTKYPYPYIRKGFDILIQNFLRERREKHWIHCPSLVEHREAISMIDKKRSSKRQSTSFVNPI